MADSRARRLNIETLKILKDARALIEKGWTWGTEARDKNGRPVGVHFPEAVRFCLLGAVNAADSRADRIHARLKARQFLSEALALLPSAERTPKGGAPTFSLIGFNDDLRSKAKVLKLYDSAISNLEKKLA